ncbi:GMC oxidoreductase [Streptomyces sp. NPDC002537]
MAVEITFPACAPVTGASASPVPVPDFTEDADVAIVGSGPTGAAYARLITEALPSAKVLMLEAGPAVTEPRGGHVANIVDPDERERARIASQGPNQYRYGLAAASAVAHNEAAEERGRALITRPGLFPVGSGDLGGDGFPAAQESCNVGGMGSHWFGASPRPGDAERIGFLAPDVLEEAYTAAERLLKVSSTQFTDSAFAAHVERVLGEELDEGRGPRRRVQAMPMAVERTASGVRRCGTDVVLGPLLSGRHPDFELRAETVCERVLVTDGRAVGVRVRDRATGTVTDVRAPYVVVAADPLRTPQLLFASGVRPEALGRYLNEHPQVSIMAEVDFTEPGAGDGDGTGRAPVMSDSTVSTMPASGVTWIPYEGERFPFHGMLTRIDPATVARGAGRGETDRPLLSVHFFTSQEPRFDNRLEFSETDTDWLGLPAMTIHHTLSAQDRETLAYAQAEVVRLSKVLGRPVAGETPWVLPSGSSLHYQGTVRMGAVDDGTSVCGPDCRVWGVENLYVAGNGVIPTRTACNPTLTSVALSVIGARDIVRRLRPERTGAAPADAPAPREGTAK